MKDFSNASFAPETLSIMKNALDAAVASVGNVYVSFGVDGDAVGSVELSRLVSGLAPRFDPVADLVDFRHA